MKNKNVFLILIFSYIILLSPSKSYENKILFKVNNEIITSIDILEEIEYLKMINDNLENLKKEKIFEISQNSIIREKIKIIELSKYFEKLEIEEKYVDMLINNLINKLKLKNEIEFKKYLNKRGLNYGVIKNKIQIELLWNQLVATKYSKDIKIDKDKIRKQIKLNNLFSYFIFINFYIIIFNFIQVIVRRKIIF